MRGGAVAGIDVTGLKQAEGTLADVRELVGDDGVQAGLVEGHLDEVTVHRLVAGRAGPKVTRSARQFGSPEWTDGAN